MGKQTRDLKEGIFVSIKDSKGKSLYPGQLIKSFDKECWIVRNIWTDFQSIVPIKFIEV